MKIELTQEERKILLCMTERAKKIKEMEIPNTPLIVSMMSYKKYETLINKLSEKKCEK